MLVDLTALWTLNSIDNFAFILFQSQMRKSHREILDDQDFMKVQVTKDDIDSSYYWIKIWEWVIIISAIAEERVYNIACEDKNNGLSLLLTDSKSYLEQSSEVIQTSYIIAQWVHWFARNSIITIPLWKWIIYKCRKDGCCKPKKSPQNEDQSNDDEQIVKVKTKQGYVQENKASPEQIELTQRNSVLQNEESFQGLQFYPTMVRKPESQSNSDNEYFEGG